MLGRLYVSPIDVIDSLTYIRSQGNQLSALLLENRSTTAHQLLAGGYDVIVCSFEFVGSSYRYKKEFPEEINHYLTQDRTTQVPQRPTAALYSELWKLLNLPIKRTVIDEAHKVNKRKGARHQAIKALHTKAFTILSGTLAHNMWHNFSGYVDFVSGHPFESHAKFLHAFSTFDYDDSLARPDAPRMRLLQRFLQAFTIVRPASLLKLEDCERVRVQFPLSAEEAYEVNKLTMLYLRAAAANQSKRASKKIDASDSVQEHLVLAIRAQLTSMHPLLVQTRKAQDTFVDIDEDDPDEEYVDHMPEDRELESRAEWLQRLEEHDLEELCQGSTRLTWILELFGWLQKKFEGEKIVVFSTMLRFLDILAYALRNFFGIEALRYDGTVKPAHRQAVEKAFAEAPSNIPVLVTAGAGGVGLNLTAASKSYQTISFLFSFLIIYLLKPISTSTSLSSTTASSSTLSPTPPSASTPPSS